MVQHPKAEQLIEVKKLHRRGQKGSSSQIKTSINLLVELHYALHIETQAASVYVQAL